MVRQKQPDVYMDLAVRALQRIPVFLADCSLEDYLADELRQAAVERQLEIAGDALGQLRKLDPVLFAQIPGGDLIVGFRNVLAHGYATLDHRRVYLVASTKVASLEALLGRFLSDSPAS